MRLWKKLKQFYYIYFLTEEELQERIEKCKEEIITAEAEKIRIIEKLRTELTNNHRKEGILTEAEIKENVEEEIKNLLHTNTERRT